MATLVVLAVFGVSAIYTQLPPDYANFIMSLRSGQLSRLDRAALERGYYEDLTRVNRFNNQLWEVYMSRPKDWLDVRGSGLIRLTGDFAQKDLVPSFVAHTDWSEISTNRWGMRDRDYEKEPAPGTVRIALLGASLDMGWGVEDGETYEAILEQKLNEDAGAPSGPRYEILNFAVAGYFPLQQMASLDRALEFQPDVVFFVAHGLELTRAADYVHEAVRKGIDIPYEYLREVVASSTLEPSTSETEGRRLLEPYRRDILSWTYRRTVELCGERGITSVLLMFEHRSAGEVGARQIPETLEVARLAGFSVVELASVYEGYDLDQIRLAEWDKHPNALGHRLIAEQLHGALLERPELINAAESSD